MKTDLKPQMLANLEKTHGMVRPAALLTNISHQTHYDWLESDAEYKRAVDALKDLQIDFVEQRLFGRIEKGDTTAIIYYLKTQGKARGWGDRPQAERATATQPPTYNEPTHTR